MEKVGWGEETIFSKLKLQYEEREWVLLPQVRAATGGYVTRTADALAMNCWHSRGLVVHGFEFKSRRSDWLRELKAPEKQEQSVYRYCDRWWIVAGHPDIVKLEEVPDPWGFARPEGDKLKIVKKAPKLEAVELDRPFIASVLRNVRDKSGLPDTILRKKYQEGFEEGRKAALGQRQFEMERLRAAHEQLQALHREFEQTSGIRINRWTMGDVGELVQLLRGFRPVEILQRSQKLWQQELATAQRQLDRLQTSIEQAEALEKKREAALARRKRKRTSPSPPDPGETAP
jgi:hypothetical protein